MSWTITDPILMYPDCLEQWPSHINDTNWHITKACKSDQPIINPAIIVGVVIGAIIFLFIWTWFIARYSEKYTVSQLRYIPSYELHETVEAMYEKSLSTTAKKETYKTMWKDRYTSIEYTEHQNGHGGKRTITIVEDLRKIPQVTSWGLSKIAVEVPNSYFRSRVAVRWDARRRAEVVVSTAPTRPAVAGPVEPTRPAVAVTAAPTRDSVVGSEPRRDSESLPQYQPPPPYTS